MSERKVIDKNEEVFLAVDQVLPIIQLADPCEVEIRITAERVWLRIGQRDIGWDRKTGKQTDSGTMLDGT